MGSTYFSKRIPQRTNVRSERVRPKTFKTEESAKAWADKNGVKKYSLENLKSTDSKTKKIRIVSE